MTDLEQDVAKKADELEARLTSPDAFINRELSWLQFARRVLALAADSAVPLLERVKFSGILGMLHDEFFMKRISGLKRQISRKVQKLSIDGRDPQQELAACRQEILSQMSELDAVLNNEIRPDLAAAGMPILDHAELPKGDQEKLSRLFTESILPTLTPLAVDAEHPFPFISNLGLNLAALLGKGSGERFVRLKVPANRARWVPLAEGGFVPLEQVIAANLEQLFPGVKKVRSHFFRLTRGAEGEPLESATLAENGGPVKPGSIIRQVTDELKARRFAGEVRLQVSSDMPQDLCTWLATQLNVTDDDVYVTSPWLGLHDLLAFDSPASVELRYPPHSPVVHRRLQGLESRPSGSIFDEIRRGDILLHHPYHDFDSSVVRFLETAATDDRVLAIKLTIYRTSSESPIVRALGEAARRGKQVAVLVEITARFDEAPNIAWGRLLENEGVHVAYGVEKLKTHVKLALVVREEPDGVRRYVHVGTGNYHSRTARVYEDLGILSSDPELSADVAAVFNELTSATPCEGYRKLLVAPRAMRVRFIELIRREAEHARQGRRSGVRAKMNQLQDPEMIRELYRASQAGVPISLNVRGLCCLRPGVAGLSETIRVFSVIGRFLEHGRVYRFENDGAPELFLGSADWMKRNLDRRVETIMPVTDPTVMAELDALLQVYEEDNVSAWDLQPDGRYVRRHPHADEEPRPAQQRFMLETT
jgi:polyphosphate kinase